ncbi:uncharacterized protein LOC119324200 [Triticum dicoccoides]|uniref:uncharacterized protein LOC119324200 n=1 Tax=Triticum dicoccoides TaxID=85692 RepID=UPI000E7B0DAE|nr:uncharacterized protein LOC119324200 [Triticum dicoccoides]
MSPRSRKTAFKQSKFAPVGCLRTYCWYKEVRRAQRAVDKTLYALMKVFDGMERQVDYQSRDPDIVEWEKVAPFGGRVFRGDRSSQDYTESWTCLCTAENGPSRRRLFDIPALQCRSCGREAELDFDFVYDDTLLNGNPAIRMIRNQIGGHCASYAWTAGAEIDQTIEVSLEGQMDVKLKPLIAQDLVKRHERFRKRICRAKGRLKHFNFEVSDDVFNMDALKLVGALVKVYGIKQEGTKKRHEIGKRHKIDGCTVLDKNNFAEICTAIADGPVIATFRPGKDCNDLVCGQVYKAADTEKFLAGNYEDLHHAVVLVGAGRIKRKKYFHFLNSWGEKFCMKVSANGIIFRGGIGMIRAKDLSSDPIHLRRRAKI